MDLTQAFVDMQSLDRFEAYAAGESVLTETTSLLASLTATHRRGRWDAAGAQRLSTLLDNAKLALLLRRHAELRKQNQELRAARNL